jgi:hypothetical protein
LGWLLARRRQQPLPHIFRERHLDNTTDRVKVILILVTLGLCYLCLVTTRVSGGNVYEPNSRLLSVVRAVSRLMLECL